jgi:hypothetical protein
MSLKQFLLNLKIRFAGAFKHPASLFLFVGAALIAPIALVSLAGEGPNNLPWFFWVFVVLLALVVTGVGFWKFARKRHDAQDISISPGRQNW